MIKLIIFLLTATLLTTLVTWLWQRQPNPKQLESSNQESTSAAKLQATVADFVTDPQDYSVFIKNQVEVKGKTETRGLIAVYSNDQQYVTKSNSDGQFNQSIELESGLNLINIVAVSSNETKQAKTLTLYLTKSSDSKNVFAGSVKNIFDTLITLSTANGERNARTGKSTDFDIPKDEDEKEATTSGVKLVRIGDYAIALGDKTDNDTLLAQSVEILREDKPLVTEQFIQAEIISNVRQNLFSIRSEENSKIIELTLTKNTQVQLDSKEGKITDIVKDKNSIVFYHQQDNKDIADLIYLLP